MSLPRKDNIVIELYGLPGVGKSTLAKRLQSEYGCTIISHEPKKWRAITLTLRHPKVVFCWLNIIVKNFWKTKNSSLLTHNISLLFSSLQKIDDAKNDTSTSIKIIDEGLIQRFLSYSDILLSEKDIERVLAISPIGTHVILVNDREPLSNRYTNTNNVRAKLGGDYLERWQSNQRLLLVVISNVLTRINKVRLYNTAEISADAILTSINKL